LAKEKFSVGIGRKYMGFVLNYLKSDLVISLQQRKLCDGGGFLGANESAWKATIRASDALLFEMRDIVLVVACREHYLLHTSTPSIKDVF
jgi:hypothetical protein